MRRLPLFYLVGVEPDYSFVIDIHGIEYPELEFFNSIIILIQTC